MGERKASEAKSKVESREKAEVSGSYGFVIKPDDKTQQKAETLAKEMAPDAEYQTTIPHITLYHGRVSNLPLRTVKAILPELRKHRGESLVLNSFEIYGDKFLFWDNEKTEALLLMHKEALKLANHLDKNAVARAVEEGLNMTSEEQENIKIYGHPLVLGRYTPHITLAYDSRGLVLPQQAPVATWEMKIDDVFFAEMGKYGSVTRVVHL